jgi:uncharacterized protein DUF4231
MIQNRPSPEIRLAVRIGVIGHGFKNLGPNAENSILVEKMQKIIEGIQSAAKLLAYCNELYADKCPALRIISPMGRGAELLVTREAVDKGFELQCILPVEANRYKGEFLDPFWHRCFDTLFNDAQVKIELDSPFIGKPSAGKVRRKADRKAAREAARETAGQAVLRQCDLLLAVSSSESGTKGYPGTIVAEALSLGITIIWIDSQQDHNVYLLERGEKPGASARKLELKNLFDRLTIIFNLSPTIGSQGLRTQASMHHQIRAEKVDPTAALKRFLSKWQPRPIPLYRKFRDLIGRGWKERLKILGWSIPEEKSKTTEDCWDSLTSPNNLVGKILTNGCQFHLNRADDLANAYGDIYRSLFIITYFLGAAAVVAAFFGIYVDNLHEAFWIELFLITMILILVGLGNHFHLHERWIDYRLLAEGFRQMQYLLPLARATPAFEVPAHLEEDPGTWFNWYYRAIARDLGMISARMDVAFRETYQKMLAEFVKEQVDYHSKTSAMMELAHDRLRSLVVKWLFPSTLFACLLHLVPEKHISPWLGTLITAFAVLLLSLCAVVLPAVGAAVEGISHQGEFERIARRSKALRARLNSLLASLTKSDKIMTSKDLGAQAEYFCQIQLLEQADWRAAFVSKPLTPS